MLEELGLGPRKSSQGGERDRRMHYSEKFPIKHTSKKYISLKNAESAEGWNVVEH